MSSHCMMRVSRMLPAVLAILVAGAVGWRLLLVKPSPAPGHGDPKERATNSLRDRDGLHPIVKPRAVPNHPTEAGTVLPGSQDRWRRLLDEIPPERLADIKSALLDSGDVSDGYMRLHRLLGPRSIEVLLAIARLDANDQVRFRAMLRADEIDSYGSLEEYVKIVTSGHLKEGPPPDFQPTKNLVLKESALTWLKDGSLPMPLRAGAMRVLKGDMRDPAVLTAFEAQLEAKGDLSIDAMAIVDGLTAVEGSPFLKDTDLLRELGPRAIDVALNGPSAAKGWALSFVLRSLTYLPPGAVQPIALMAGQDLDSESASNLLDVMHADLRPQSAGDYGNAAFTMLGKYAQPAVREGAIRVLAGAAKANADLRFFDRIRSTLDDARSSEEIAYALQSAYDVGKNTPALKARAVQFFGEITADEKISKAERGRAGVLAGYLQMAQPP